MILCIDIGNTNICAGIFDQDKLLLEFRYSSITETTPDELGIFFRQVIIQNNIDYTAITKVGIASVVPHIDNIVKFAISKYFKLKPTILNSKTKMDIKLLTDNPKLIGADLIAGMIAAYELFPNQNSIVFDLGTATTCCFLDNNGQFLGSVITPGFRIMMESLNKNTAKLEVVNINTPKAILGKNTKDAINSGIFHCQLGLINEIISKISFDYNIQDKKVIATGGFSAMFKDYKCFDYIIPELVLLGIKKMLDAS